MMSSKSSTAVALLLYNAVPIASTSSNSSSPDSLQARRRKHIHQDLIDIMIRDTVQMLLSSDVPSVQQPSTPPNTPSAAAGSFQFPTPATPVLNREEVSCRLQEISTQRPASCKDGNEADESGSSDDSDDNEMLPVEMKPVSRRKRGRVCSFSNSAANVRRVPHKKKCATSTTAAMTTDEDEHNNAAIMSHHQDHVDSSSVSSRLTPATIRSTTTNSIRSAPANSSDVTREAWKNLGKDLNCIATKFTSSTIASSPGNSKSFSKKAGKSAAQPTSMIPANMITIAVNIFLWKILRKMFE